MYLIALEDLPVIVRDRLSHVMLLHLLGLVVCPLYGEWKVVSDY